MNLIVVLSKKVLQKTFSRCSWQYFCILSSEFVMTHERKSKLWSYKLKDNDGENIKNTVT